MRISSLVEIPLRPSPNPMVVSVVSSPRLHASCEALAFLSESSNRVTITGTYLSAGQAYWFRKQKDIQTYTIFPLLCGENSSQQTTRGTRPCITYLAGITLILDYKGLSEP